MPVHRASLINPMSEVPTAPFLKSLGEIDDPSAYRHEEPIAFSTDVPKGDIIIFEVGNSYTAVQLLDAIPRSLINYNWKFWPFIVDEGDLAVSLKR